MIETKEDIERMVNERGFLPFFVGDIAGFSIEEETPRDLWFSDEHEGPWEWKGPVIVDGDCAYGKFYKNKAMYVSMEWFPDFINWRRSLYHLTAQEEKVLDVLKAHHSLLSRQLKRESGYQRKAAHRSANPLLRASEHTAEAAAMERDAIKSEKQPRVESFDTCITHLQMATYVVTADFEYNYDKQGRRYGWGVARYCTPEDFFGPERLVVDRTPEQSARRLFDHLRRTLTWATDKQIWDVIQPPSLGH